MSRLIDSEEVMASSISALRASMRAEYSSKAEQISILKSSMTTKSGKKGKISSILSRLVDPRNCMALLSF